MAYEFRSDREHVTKTARGPGGRVTGDRPDQEVREEVRGQADAAPRRVKAPPEAGSPSLGGGAKGALRRRSRMEKGRRGKREEPNLLERIGLSARGSTTSAQEQEPSRGETLGELRARGTGAPTRPMTEGITSRRMAPTSRASRARRRTAGSPGGRATRATSRAGTARTGTRPRVSRTRTKRGGRGTQATRSRKPPRTRRRRAGSTTRGRSKTTRRGGATGGRRGATGRRRTTRRTR